MRYFIGLSLPRDLQEKILPLSLRVDPRYSEEYPLHITLVPTFEMETAEEGHLSQGLSDLALAYHHQPLEIAGLTSFNKFNTSLEIKPTEWLAAFREALTNLTGEDSKRPFQPHITLGKLLLEGRSREGFQLAAGNLTGTVFYPESIDLFKHREDRAQNPKRWESFYRHYLLTT